ncbi:uncharacterized protein SOCE26_030230 [Sorangium cellulosum]|uniref:Uncharacterized protein n=1 Tax=Sorangium cellulosum TaxID=56 RepID=A0A2L0EQR9_SORCE|nr:uncharacterized protein SOCE26_030230 [Sorangium cellulosum]
MTPAARREGSFFHLASPEAIDAIDDRAPGCGLRRRNAERI